jgi:hypothetical protein
LSLNYVTLKGTIPGVAGAFVSFAPTGWLIDSTDHLDVPPSTQTVQLTAAGTFEVSLLATDNANIPGGWLWTVGVSGIVGVDPWTFSFELPYASGATQYLDQLSPAQPTPGMTAYLPLTYPNGAAANYVWTCNAEGVGSWEPPPGGVSEVNGQTGNVVLTAAEVGADPSGSAAAAIAACLPTLTEVSVSASAALALNKVTEVTASSPLTMTLPASVGNSLIVAERASASTANVTVTGNIRGVSSSSITLQLGSESEMFFGDGVTWWPIAGHKTLTSLQALFLQIANNLSDLSSPATARANLGLGTAATQASTAFDASGLAGTAQSNAESFATAAVATETSRAEAAEAAALQKSSNLSDLQSASTARTNLGLGTAATQAASSFDSSGAATAVETYANATFVPLSEVAAANGVASLGGGTTVPTSQLPAATSSAIGAVKLPAASVSFHPSNPTGTASLTQVMMGLGSAITYTPTGSGKVIVTITAVLATPTAASAATIGGRYSGGTAPSNGAGNTGTAFGPTTDETERSPNAASTSGGQFVVTDRLSLTPNSTYWFDLSVASVSTGDTVEVISICAVIAEQLS